MTKEEAKAKLRKAESDLRMANVVLEMHEQGVQEIKDEITELEAVINKKDDWRDELVQPDKGLYFYLISCKYDGLSVCFDSETERKPEYAFRTHEQAELIKNKILLMQEMHAFAHVKNCDWVADWDDSSQRKYGIILCENKAHVDHFIRMNQLVFGVAVKSKAIAEEMLEIFGERIEQFYNKMY